MRIAVVGAGVIGLSAAIRLAEAGHEVRIVAEHRTPHTTSDVAAAIHFPYLAEPRARILAWATTSLAALRTLAKDPASGVVWTPTRIVDPEANPWWADAVDEFRVLPGKSAWGHAFTCQVPVVAMPAYMAYLEAWATRLGVRFEQRRLSSFAQAGPADVIVNCSGLGARELAQDASMVAIQGQVVRVHAPGVHSAVLVESDPPTYVIPRRDGVVIGGTAVRGAEGTVADAAVEADLLRRGLAEEPALAGATVLSRAVGLRPGRPSIRLECDDSGPVPIIHNYGHGGSGVTLSWGCADEVTALVDERSPAHEVAAASANRYSPLSVAKPGTPMPNVVAVQKKGNADLDNYHTLASGRVESTKDLSAERMHKLLDECLPHLKFGETFRRKANIDGIIIELVTNSRHQYEFWTENWHAAGDDIKPHGHLYSIVGVPNSKVHAYYCPSLDTALFVNTDYYGQCKSWALGLAAVVLERKFNTHSIHGAAAEVDGKGIVIIAPTGTGKTTQVNRLMQHPTGKVIGDDWIYIHHPTGISKEERLHVYQPEVALYVRTENAENEPWLIPTFDRCKVENVVREEGKCEAPSCQKGHCMFKQGYPYCYWGFGNSRALLPREWMMGAERVKDETRIDLIVLLRRDDKEPSVVELNEDSLVKLLQEGRTLIRPGAGPREKWGTYASEPWYNPYLLAPDHKRQEDFFRNEARRAKCVVLNTAHQSIDETYKLILKFAGVKA